MNVLRSDSGSPGERKAMGKTMGKPAFFDVLGCQWELWGPFFEGTHLLLQLIITTILKPWENGDFMGKP